MFCEDSVNKLLVQQSVPIICGTKDCLYICGIHTLSSCCSCGLLKWHFLQDKTWKIVDALPINEFSRAKMDATAAELVEERDTAVAFLSA